MNVLVTLELECPKGASHDDIWELVKALLQRTDEDLTPAKLHTVQFTVENE